MAPAAVSTAKSSRAGRAWTGRFSAIDWLLPPALARSQPAPEELARARFIAGSLATITIVALFFGVQTRLAGAPRVDTIMSVGATLVYGTALVVFRRTGNLRLASMGLSIVLSAAIIASACTGAGFRSLVASWSVAVPFVITYLSGKRAGILSGLALGVTTLLLFGAEQLGFFSPDPEAIRFMFAPAPMMITGLVVLWTLLFISALFQASQRRALLQLEERTVSLRQANASLAAEMNARLQMELELRQAQKLESVGRLAAGVAHEINTPAQFVSDSLHFVRGSMEELGTLIDRYRGLCRAAREGRPIRDEATRIEREEANADLAYILEHTPAALDRSLEGVSRIATIVRSLKEFAHPDQREMAPIDLNHAVESTLTVARNEYRYVADLATDLGALPPVTCHVGDMNQVVLNLVVNAAHAVADVTAGGGGKGRITVRTRQDGDDAVIEISDTGCGIPREIRDRIFDPFFTTKEVGRGTGQGLAIARAVVLEKHGGTLTFDSHVGEGTTFVVRIPIAGRRPDRAAA